MIILKDEECGIENQIGAYPSALNGTEIEAGSIDRSRAN